MVRTCLGRHTKKKKYQLLAELRFDRRSVHVSGNSVALDVKTTYPPGYEPGALPLRHSALSSEMRIFRNIITIK